jgi:transcriptional regulator with XRE-family HTH domain
MIPRFRDTSAKDADRVYCSKKLVAALRDHSMSQSDLARYLGVSRDAVSTWCRGRSLPEAETLARIAKKFNMQPSDFLLKQPEVVAVPLSKKFNPALIASAPRRDLITRLNLEDDGLARLTLDIRIPLARAVEILALATAEDELAQSKRAISSDDQ